MILNNKKKEEDDEKKRKEKERIFDEEKKTKIQLFDKEIQELKSEKDSLIQSINFAENLNISTVITEVNNYFDSYEEIVRNINS